MIKYTIYSLHVFPPKRIDPGSLTGVVQPPHQDIEHKMQNLNKTLVVY